MAIQFACPSCRQPIEVDNEHAGKQVSCPFCRSVVTSPAESTLQLGTVPTAEVPTQVQTGIPVPPMASGYTPQQAPPPPAPAWTGASQPTWPPVGAPGGVDFHAQRPRNTPGIIGLLCGLVAVGLIFATVSIAVKHHRDLGVDPDGEVNQMEMQQRMMEMMKDVNKHPWLTKMLGAFFGAMFFWVVGLICSAMGMSRRYHSKGAAIAGLILSAVPLFLCCSGFFTK